MLYAIISNPGMAGLDLGKAIGMEHRSSVDSNIRRLIRQGMIEDRREREGRAIPTTFTRHRRASISGIQSNHRGFMVSSGAGVTTNPVQSLGAHTMQRCVKANYSVCGIARGRLLCQRSSEKNWCEPAKRFHHVSADAQGIGPQAE